MQERKAINTDLAIWKRSTFSGRLSMNILPWPSCNKSCKLGCLIKRIIYQPAAGFSKFRFFSAFLLSRPFLPRTNLVHSSFMIHQTLASAHLVAQIKILTETCNFCNLGQVVATPQKCLKKERDTVITNFVKFWFFASPQNIFSLIFSVIVQFCS